MRRSPHDWEAIHKELEALQITRRDYAAQKGMNYTNLSRHLAAIDRRIEQEAIEDAKKLLARSAPIAAKGLIGFLEDDDANIKLKAQTAILDRVGITAKSAEVQIMNVQAGQAIIAPIFNDQQLGDNLRTMLGGSESVDE